MDVIARIKYYMDLHSWTEYRLAKESGLAQSTISNIFLRNTLPSIPTLEAICNAFGISLSRFFEDEKAQDDASDFMCLWEKLSQNQREVCLQLIQTLLDNKK